MPWKNFKIGSYYLRQTQISKIVPDHKEASSLYEFNDVSTPMKVLDLLGQVKWRINKRVLDVSLNYIHISSLNIFGLMVDKKGQFLQDLIRRSSQRRCFEPITSRKR